MRAECVRCRELYELDRAINVIAVNWYIEVDGDCKSDPGEVEVKGFCDGCAGRVYGDLEDVLTTATELPDVPDPTPAGESGRREPMEDE